MSLDDRNYYYDRRVIAGERARWWKSLDEKRMRATVELCYEHPDGESDDVEEEREVPFKFAVCPICSGKGAHVNPSIDAHGITADEWAEWDDEDRENYRSGAYDVPCYECGGARVVPVLDRENADAFVVECIEAQARSDAESRAIERAERAMGA